MRRLVTLVAPVEAIVERIDYMVGVGETVMSPFSVTEHAFRNMRSPPCATGLAAAEPVPHRHPVPVPPYAEGTGLPWDVSVADAVAAIAAARASHGDTFAVHSGQDHYLFTFSPTGVESFYGLPEEKASKGRRRLSDAAPQTPRGDLRRTAHPARHAVSPRRRCRLLDQPGSGARSRPPPSWDRRDRWTSSTSPVDSATGWGSPPGRDPDRPQGEAFERLARAFDTLDGSDAFVHPDAMAAVAASNKRAERAALDEVADIVAAAVRRWDADGTDDQALFGRIVDAWRNESADIRMRGIAFDVALIHIASMSNLAAALGMGVGRLARAPGTSGAGRRRRRATWRSGAHWSPSAWLSAPSCPAPCCPRCLTGHRRCQLPGAAGMDHRHVAAPAQHLRCAGTRDTGTRTDGRDTGLPTRRRSPRPCW